MGASAGSKHPSSATAHDVLREFRILDAIKDEPVTHRPAGVGVRRPGCLGAPFYIMERVEVLPASRRCPSPGRRPARAVQALDELSTPWSRSTRSIGAPRAGRSGPQRRLSGAATDRWISSSVPTAGGSSRPPPRAAYWLEVIAPSISPSALCHGDYKLDNVLFAPDAPPQLLAVVDWEMAASVTPSSIWPGHLIFHPGPEGNPPGMPGSPGSMVASSPTAIFVDRATAAFRSRHDGDRLV